MMLGEMGRHSMECRFGEWLVRQDLLTEEDISKALMDQRRNGGRLGQVLSRLRVLTEQEATAALAGYLSVDRWSLDDLSDIDVELAQSLPERVARRFELVVISKSSDGVLVAMADPLDVVAKDTVTQTLGCKVQVVVSSVREIHKAIEAVYHGCHAQEQRIRDLVDVMVSTEGPEADAGDCEGETADISGEVAACQAPVVRFVDLMLSQAVQSRASDVHIEPQDKSLVIRMRVDGVLQNMIPPPRNMQAAVIARMKILSGLDIAERRLPQDGRLKIRAPGRDIDVRVSVIPTIYGEKVVTRILDKEAVDHDLDKLGFEPKLLRGFKDSISKPHGIIIVTGPTGSGKSTTLYSALNFLRDPSKNITTVEDPVEYRLGGINQIQIRPEIGLTFAGCLRSILRQDPDIILIGEIRDRETMEIAIQASLTGHLVLTTFHTNDAPSALTRLAYMGLERYLLASTLNLVTAQRLVRKVCERCKESVDLEDSVLRTLDIPQELLDGATFFQGTGCKACNGTGYAGRLPIFEFLPLDDDIKGKVTQGASEADIRAAARAKGYGGLLDSAIGRLCAGLTTVEEVLRVAFVYTKD